MDKSGGSWLANVQVDVALGGTKSYIDATFIDLAKPENSRVSISMDTEAGSFGAGSFDSGVGNYWYDLDGSEI